MHVQMKHAFEQSQKLYKTLLLNNLGILIIQMSKILAQITTIALNYLQFKKDKIQDSQS